MEPSTCFPLEMGVYARDHCYGFMRNRKNCVLRATAQLAETKQFNFRISVRKLNLNLIRNSKSNCKNVNVKYDSQSQIKNLVSLNSIMKTGTPFMCTYMTYTELYVVTFY